IAQDVVTVAVAVPLLLGALLFARSQASRRHPAAQLVLAGTLLYFLVTYTFYLAMATYNALFLVYALLMGCSFFALLVVVLEAGPSFTSSEIPEAVVAPEAPGSHRLWGSVLIINAALIGMLWLSVVVPPLVDGSLYPDAVQHYTTLIVQGFDLGLLLPASMVIGVLLRRSAPLGRLFGPIYFVFLSLIMTALVAKLIAMELSGAPTAPAIFIIPMIAALAITGAVRILPRR
ncbi:MAG TPA: hypothetical protein VJ932_06050, partial [Alkalispirochaeta sp.]|nr:hypothetical protein [Alkalispirochaeta sp.]